MTQIRDHTSTQPSFPRAYRPEILSDLESRRGELRRGRLTLKGKLSADIFRPASTLGSDTTWVEYWTDLGELLKPICYFLNSWALEGASQVTYEADVDRMMRFAGSPDRLISNGLDEFFWQGTSDVERGSKVLDAIVKAVDRLASRNDQLVEGTSISEDARPLSAREAEASMQLIRFVRWVILGRLSEILGIGGVPPVEFEAVCADADAIKYVWLSGFLDRGMPTESAPGILLLAREIGRSISTESPIAASFDEDDPFSVLAKPGVGLPPSLAERFSAKAGWLLEHRNRLDSTFGYRSTGIREPGTSELDRLSFTYLFDAQRQDSFVVIAPTSSGKSRLGQLAVSAAVARRRREGQFGRVIVLVPTKALVKQSSNDIRALFDTSETARWTVLEGSRDYPQNDENLRLGNFDVAVCIPEKVSALIRIGMSIARTPLIVVDEMQHLVDGNRGRQLELLLVDLFRQAPRIRWIGLSASISKSTRDLIQAWFEVNGKPVVIHEAEYRPVPLQVIATDGVNSRTKSPFSPDYKGREIDTSTPWRGSAASVRNKDWKNTAKTYDYLLRIIAGLLSAQASAEPDGPLPSILVFVSARRLAENLAGAFAVVAAETGILPDFDAASTPFVSGRFPAFISAGLEPEPSAADLLDSFNELPPGRLRRQMKGAIASGIAFHTSTLDGPLRETIEDAFRRGYVRILFATDTLKLGVNLPADIVVNGDFVLNAGPTQRLLDKDSVIQRIGRAGRLGLSQTHGTGVIAVSPEFLRSQYLDFEIGIDERIGLTGSATSRDEKVIEAATHVNPVFEHYLADWDGGAVYSPPLNDLWLLEAAGRILADSPRARLERTEFLDRTLDLFVRSLPGTKGYEAPQDVIIRLEQRGIIALDGDAVRLTRLGRVSSLGSLGIGSTEMIESVSRAAREGAGPLTLIYEICASDVVFDFGYTYRMQCSDRTAEGTRKKIVGFAHTLLARRRGSHPALFRLQSDDVLDVCGTGARADALRAVIEQAHEDIRSISPRQLTALWRAVVLTEWWGGRTVSRLETMIGGDAGLLVDETDIRQLADGIANVFAMLADFLGSAPQDMTFRSLIVFSQELEIGLPGVLTSLVRTNDRSMHRERLLGLLPVLAESDYRWDEVTDLLSWYQQASDGIPLDSKGRRADREWSTLTPESITRVAELLDKQRLLEEESTLQLPNGIDSVRIPANSPATMADLMKEMERGESIEVIEGLLDAFEIRYDRIDNRRVEFLVHVPGLSGPVKLLVADRTVDQEYVAGVIESPDNAINSVVVTLAGSTAGVLHHSRFLVDRCAVIEPNLFLEMFARIYLRFSPAVDEYDLDEGDGDFNAEAAAELLGRMLVNNAPVITRSDLENRLRHDDLA